MSSEAGRGGRRLGGFTLPELIIVMVVGAILAVVALPKLQGAASLRDDAWRDQVVGALRYAQKTAVSHRRLVCVEVAAASISLTIATVNPSAACNADLSGPDGTGTYAISANASAGTSVSPSGVIFFQPDGRATVDGVGSAALSRVIAMSGASPVVLHGETGFVE